jgi:alpha-tubulin suppressor-like RCC1 family protein
MPDAQLGDKDLDDEYITDAWLVDQYVGNVLFGWGNSTYGELGVSATFINYNSPVQVGSLVDWKQVSAGYYSTISIKTDGSLWSWGANTYGQLGQSDTTNRSSPVKVGLLTEWKQVSSGGGFACAVKTNGTLWAWGYNGSGNLGQGASITVTYSSPVQVGSETNWKQVSCGQNTALAIKTDGSLWAWGSFGSGALGLGSLVPGGSPSRVGALTNNWKQVTAGSGTNPGTIEHTVAIKTDGTLWAWGLNSSGQLGLSNITNYSSPVQVGTLSNWARISDNVSGHSAAIKTDGTLWAWGLNSSGQLGQGNTVNYSSPVQVGTLANWKQVTCGYTWTTAIKTDGTLWAWGGNTYGQLGLGTSVTYSSPVQVGSLSNWKQITDGTESSLAITYREI